MSSKKDKKHKYQSFQEFKKSLYPNMSKQEFVKSADPQELGITLAQKSIVKLRASVLNALAE